MKCNHYHLRFRVANAKSTTWWIDDVRMIKIVNENSTVADVEALVVRLHMSESGRGHLLSSLMPSRSANHGSFSQ